MDPYSSEGELINIHAAFHQYQYQSVLDDFDPESFSQENHLPARVLQLRSRVALGQAQDVLDEVAGEKQPELAAVAALAELSLGNGAAAVGAVEKLLAEGGDAAGENAIVQVLGGTVLAAGGKAEEALALLGRHQGNRECRQLHPFFSLVMCEDYFLLGVFVMLPSRRCRFDRPDPPTTEPQRLGTEGGCICQTMGAGQHFGKSGRVVGWLETGTDLSREQYWTIQAATTRIMDI